jgi:hypothetical protein
MTFQIRPLSELLPLMLVALIASTASAQPVPPRPNPPAPQQPIRRASENPSQPWSTIDTQTGGGGNMGGGYGGWGMGWGGGGGTVAGNYMNGVANAVRAQGDYNLTTSQAYVNMGEAQRRNIENRKLWTDAYFDMRRANADYRAAERGPRGTQEDWVRYAKEAAPNRLSPGELDYVTGGIAWPRALQDNEFTALRDELEKLYSKRADMGGSIGPDTYRQIRNTTDAMQAQLKRNVKKYRPHEYIDAKKFIESLAYEARFTSG